MPIKHKKSFGIYHWDTFDHETLLIDEADTIEEAMEKVQQKYGPGKIPRIRGDGADKVDIVDLAGNVVTSYRVG